MAATSPQTSGARMLKDRYAHVRQRVADAAARSGRDARQVSIVAVSKYAEPDQIRELIQLGHADFGESQVQQLIQRAAIIDEWLARRSMGGAASSASSGAAGSAGGGGGAVRWHMIGHLQRNKVRKAAEICRLIHSVDSLRLAEEIQLIAARLQADAERHAKHRAPDRAPDLSASAKSAPHSPLAADPAVAPGTVDVLLQVNISGEKSKFGCSVPAAIHLAEQIDTMIQLRLRGLMTMAPYSPNPEDSRRTFALCRELFDEIRTAGIAPAHFNILSMGMSTDYQVAIEEGATLVRIGTGIFGEPKPGVREADGGSET